jgi:hypothetical protein
VSQTFFPVMTGAGPPRMAVSVNLALLVSHCLLLAQQASSRLNTESSPSSNLAGFCPHHGLPLPASSSPCFASPGGGRGSRLKGCPGVPAVLCCGDQCHTPWGPCCPGAGAGPARARNWGLCPDTATYTCAHAHRRAHAHTARSPNSTHTDTPIHARRCAHRNLCARVQMHTQGHACDTQTGTDFVLVAARL